MNWYKCKVSEGTEGTYIYSGCSMLDLETILAMAKNGEYIRLDELRYMERGDVKEWAEWDKSIIPSVSINPQHILSIMQFKGDPLITPSK